MNSHLDPQQGSDLGVNLLESLSEVEQKLVPQHGDFKVDVSGKGHTFILQTRKVFQRILWSQMPVTLLGKFSLNHKKGNLSTLLTALGLALLLLAKIRRTGLQGERVQVQRIEIVHY